MTLSAVFGVEAANVLPTLAVHFNVLVYAMAYWMNLSLLPFLTKGNSVVLSVSRRSQFQLCHFPHVPQSSAWTWSCLDTCKLHSLSFS